MKLYQLLFAWIVVLAVISISYGLLICAFNIRQFGDKKRNNAKVMDIIVEIIKRYHVILIQEVRDSTQDSSATIAALKKRGLTGFTYVSSEELGTSHYKERYLFLIRENAGLTVEDRFQFDNISVPFERSPFSIKLRSKRSETRELKEFVLSAIHVKPGKGVTEKEIRQLKDLHEKLNEKWKTDNIIIMGDMNAGGTYIKPEDLEKLPISKPPFVWLPKDTDTMISCCVYEETTEQAKGHYDRFRDFLYTLNPFGPTYSNELEETSNAKCPYDRFIITGAALKKYLDPGKAGIFKFNEVYKLTKEEAKEVSDHYPIELLLDDYSKKNIIMEHHTEF